MMRLFLALMAALLPSLAHAGLADLILKRIEQTALYPYTKARMAPGQAAAYGMQETQLAADGAKLLIWHSPPADPGGPVVLYFHGNAGTLEVRGWRFEAFRDAGIGVIAPALRGGAGSTGTPSETALITDALAVYKRILAQAPATSPQSIILYGESLGAAVALGLLDNLPPDLQPAGLILEAPFTSIPDMARATMDVPDTLIARIRDTWDSLSRAKAVTVPLLVIHGSEDAVTPNAMGRALFSAAPTRDKDLVIVQGAGHTNTWTLKAQRRLWRFINAYAR